MSPLCNRGRGLWFEWLWACMRSCATNIKRTRTKKSVLSFWLLCGSVLGEITRDYGPQDTCWSLMYECVCVGLQNMYSDCSLRSTGAWCPLTRPLISCLHQHSPSSLALLLPFHSIFESFHSVSPCFSRCSLRHTYSVKTPRVHSCTLCNQSNHMQRHCTCSERMLCKPQRQTLFHSTLIC